jgi:hypothetical protein
VDFSVGFPATRATILASLLDKNLVDYNIAQLAN